MINISEENTMATREHQGTPKGEKSKQRGGQQGRLNPVQLQKYLGGLDYPVSKEDIIERAQEKGADDRVMSVLEQLPDREYDAPTAVSKEAARIIEGQDQEDAGGKDSPRAGRRQR